MERGLLPLPAGTTLLNCLAFIDSFACTKMLFSSASCSLKLKNALFMRYGEKKEKKSKNVRIFGLFGFLAFYCNSEK